MFVGWAFLWNRYATINWAAAYAVPVFAAQGLLLAWIGTWRGALRVATRRPVASFAGLGMFLYALVVHPFVAILMGRPIQAAEIVGIAPDPTVIATIGLLLRATGGALSWALMVVPLAWCIVSWATLRTMGALEAWVPLTAAGLALVTTLLPVGAKPPSPA